MVSTGKGGKTLAEDQVAITRVEYSERGFRQDADQAMRGQIIRGLVEAITNADDQYGNNQGQILIRVEGSGGGAWKVTVADRATGIPVGEIKQKLARLGARTSGHEAGKVVRGNRGRGGKDLASFGRVHWDTIHNGEFAWLTITRDGEVTHPKVGVPATAELRERLGIPRGNGTVVTIFCDGARVRRSQQAVLKRKLETCVPLRDIMQNRVRHVLLKYGDKPAQGLKYVPPAGLKHVQSSRLEVAGYPGPALLDLWESPEPLQSPTQGDLFRQGGILIKSGRTVHEASLFGFEGNPFASYFLGEIRWDTIEDLTRALDDMEERGEPPSPDNPISIISRSRDGLERAHPAFKALQAVVDRELKVHVDRKAKEEAAAGHESALTRRRLDELGKIIAKFRAEKDEELELESPGDGGEGEVHPTTPILQVIPPSKVIEWGDCTTFTLQLRADAVAGMQEPVETTLAVVSEPDQLVRLSVFTVPLTSTPKRQGLLRGTFVVTAEKLNGKAVVEANIARVARADTTIDVVEPVTADPPTPPLTFKFERERYTVALGKKKDLLLLAPTPVVVKHGARVKLLNSNSQGILLRNHDVVLAPSPDGDWYEASISVEARQLNATTTLVAQCGNGPLKARAEVRVAQEQSGPIVEITIKPLPGYQRAMWNQDEDTGTVEIVVNGTHPAVARYMGSPPKFDGQESREARIVVAEVVADEAVRDILQRKYPPGRSVDVTAYFVERARLLAQLLPRCHASQLPAAEFSGDLLAVGT